MKWRLSKSARLIDALREKVGLSWSARSLKRALESNACRVNGHIERFASIQVRTGDLIEFFAPLEVERKPFYQVLHEDEELFVLNKPEGAICTDLFFHKALGISVYLAHRLDRDTTGVLLFGKSPRIAKELQALFEERTVEKEYLAVVDGIPKQSSGMIRSHLVKKKSFEGQTIWGSSPADTGLYAETEWEMRSTIGQDAALICCRPKTGRTHQIRVHLAEMGHPILIDRQYSSRFRSSIHANRTLLHASLLKFVWRGHSQEFKAPLPADFPIFVQ